MVRNTWWQEQPPDVLAGTSSHLGRCGDTEKTTLAFFWPPPLPSLFSPRRQYKDLKRCVFQKAEIVPWIIYQV